ncbi:MAG: hypothetical protein ACP5O7_10680 [Phycisphaerae bacterium]
MGVYEGRGQLAKSFGVLKVRWQETQNGWRDSASQRFEKKYLDPLETDVRLAAGAMDHISAVLSRVRRDCT